MRILKLILIFSLFGLSSCAHHYFKGCKVAGQLGGISETGVATEKAEPLFDDCERLW